MEDAASEKINHTVDLLGLLTEQSTNSTNTDSLNNEIARFYKNRNFCSFWLGSEKPLENFNILIRATEELSENGHLPFFEAKQNLLSKQAKAYDEEEIASGEVELMARYVSLARNLLEGQLKTYSSGEALYYVEQDSRNVLKDLSNLTNGRELDSLLNSYRPQIREYHALLGKFQDMRSERDSLVFRFSCDNLDWDSLARDSMTVHLRENLTRWGVSSNDDPNSVKESLATFQELRGLTRSGKLDCPTVKQLNMSRDLVMEKIALNLERLRALPRRIGREYAIVNIPEYKLRIVNDGDVSFESRVIVGKEYQPTPIFADTMSYLVFSPTWTVPQSIIHEEMIPNLRKDPSYYEKRNFKVYEGGKEINQSAYNWKSADIDSKYFRFVQQPGPSNALGLVKFIMPNDLSIYLHDTPSDYLFDQAERSLSHGCVRLEKPKELAEYLLADNEEWQANDISEAMKRDEPLKVYLKDKLPVEIVYLTTWVNENDQLAIYPDIYGHDAQQKKQLEEDFEKLKKL
jgi:murein L,D-transpeptidase YcbB/YkuD